MFQQHKNEKKKNGTIKTANTRHNKNRTHRAFYKRQPALVVSFLTAGII